MDDKITSPVFIGGCDRSGTTLLGSMLGSHPECLCTPESQFKIDILQDLDWSQGTVCFEAALRYILTHFRFKLWDLPTNLISYEFEGDVEYSDFILGLVNMYGMAKNKQGARFWIDHTPHNTRYAATLLRHFSRSRIIHIIRDGRAVAASFKKLRWGPSRLDKIASFWIKRVSYGLAAEARYNGQKVIRVYYEDLVLKPEKTLRKICRWLGIEYYDKMRKGTGFIVPQYTVKQHSLVGSELVTSRIYAWKNELSKREIEIFENVTGDLLEMLGYTMEYGAEARNVTPGELLLSDLIEFLNKHLINKIWARKRIRSIL